MGSNRGNFDKSVQVPIGILFRVKWLLSEINRESLPEREKQHFDEIKAFLTEKERKIINRMHYDEYLQAAREEKDRALETYLAYKKG